MMTQLYDLVHAGDVEGVREWMDRNPDDLNASIGERYTPVHVACMFGHEAMLALLLDRRALVNVNAMNASRATPLHLAVMFRDENVADRMIRTLIDNGAELNAKQQGGQTALHHAVARRSLKLVRTLVDAGADPVMKDDLGRSASDLAKQIAADVPQIQDELKRAYSLT